jgi:hypothetical protein
MLDWSNLHHAYGPAFDLPVILDKLKPDETDKGWLELSSRVCHQGAVHSASYAVLPKLLTLAREWQPTQRAMPLFLDPGASRVCNPTKIETIRHGMGVGKLALVHKRGKVIEKLSSCLFDNRQQGSRYRGFNRDKVLERDHRLPNLQLIACYRTPTQTGCPIGVMG